MKINENILKFQKCNNFFFYYNFYYTYDGVSYVLNFEIFILLLLWGVLNGERKGLFTPFPFLNGLALILLKIMYT